VELALLQVSALFYAAAAFSLGVHVLTRREGFDRVGAAALVGGFLVQSVTVVMQLYRLGLPPAATLREGLSFLAWLLAGGSLLIGRGPRWAAIGAIASSLSVAMIAASTVTGHGGRATVETGAWLRIHIALVLIGAAVFGIAFSLSVVYLIQERLLKTRQRGSLTSRLPSLEQLDRLNYRCLACGFPLLSLGILSGGVWAVSKGDRFWAWDTLEVFSLLTWLIYAGLLQFRLTAGFRGRRAAALTIIAFGLVIASFLSVNLLPLPGRHGGSL
jgi:cytochrome c-type biogenesis protein CcsB